MNSRSKLAVVAGVDIVRFSATGNFQPPGSDPSFEAAYGRPDIEGLFEAYSGPNPSNHASWTNFSHYKRELGTIGTSVYELPYATAWPNSGSAYWIGRFPTYFGWERHTGLGHVLPTTPMYSSSSEWGIGAPSNLETLKQRAFTSIVPGIKAQLSLINSVYELKDFKGYFKAVGKRYSRFRELTAHLPKRFWAKQTLMDLYRGWYAYLRELQQLTPGSQAYLGAKKIAGYFLEWKFNLRSVISDVLHANGALASFEKDLNRFITNEGRVRTGHWGTSYEAAGPSSRTTSYSLGPPLYPNLWVGSSIESATSATEALFHVEIRYCYNLTGYQREHARILGYLDAFGVNLNPAIIWNALKFTFIIDWVIGVSQYLDQFKVRNLEPMVNILGALWSVRYSRTTTWDKVHTGFDGMTYTQRISMPGVRESGYLRLIFSPGYSSLTTSGLSSSEFILGGALITALSRRKAKRKKS
jgi:hypothetical protein